MRRIPRPCRSCRICPSKRDSTRCLGAPSRTTDTRCKALLTSRFSNVTMGAGTLIGARLLQYSGGLVLFGASLYLHGFRRDAPRTAASGEWPWERSVILIAASVALLGALFWAMAETASM